jgi:hypothetical protein
MEFESRVERASAPDAPETPPGGFWMRAGTNGRGGIVEKKGSRGILPHLRCGGLARSAPCFANK